MPSPAVGFRSKNRGNSRMRFTPGFPHLGRDLLSLDSAGVPLDQTAIENHALVKASFKHENVFYRVRKGDPFLKLCLGFGSGEMAMTFR